MPRWTEEDSCAAYGIAMPRWGERMDRLEQIVDDQTEVRLLREQVLRASGRVDYLYYRKQYEHALHELRVKHLYQQNRLDWVTRQDMPEWRGTQYTEDTIPTGAVDVSDVGPMTILRGRGMAPSAPKPHQCQYGQGMTRGYWRGGIVGRHPGYRAP